MLHFLASHRRLIIRIIIGITSFIFLGFFVPIILSTTTVNYSKWFIPRSTPIPTSTQRQFSLQGKDIIEVVLNQIKTFYSDGSYKMALHCFRTSKVDTQQLARCELSAYPIFTPSYLAVVLDKYAKITSNSEHQKQADRKFYALIRQCIVSSRVCNEAFEAIVWRYQEYGNEDLLPMLKSAGEYLYSKDYQSVPQKILTIHKLIVLYDLLDDPKYLAKAREQFKRLEEVNNNQAEITEYVCGKHWVEAELARASGDDRLFDEAQDFFSNVQGNAHSTGNLGSQIMCLEGFDFLNKKTGNSLYLELHRSLVERILTNYWDTPYEPKFSGDYGLLLLDYSGPEKNKILNFKYLNETAWFLTHIFPYYNGILRF